MRTRPATLTPHISSAGKLTSRPNHAILTLYELMAGHAGPVLTSEPMVGRSHASVFNWPFAIGHSVFTCHPPRCSNRRGPNMIILNILPSPLRLSPDNQHCQLGSAQQTQSWQSSWQPSPHTQPTGSRRPGPSAVNTYGF